MMRRMGAAGDPQMRLAPPGAAPAPRVHEGLAKALVDNDPALTWETPAVVLGGPGTGKTSLLVDIVVEHLRGGGRAEEVMFVAPSKEAATALRDQIFDRVAQQEDYATTGSVVRSVHSWAFALLRAIRVADGGQAPRLITGAEHDSQIRMLLQGSVADGNVRHWPDFIHPALGMVGFARGLRDLLLRAAERGVDSDTLCELGRRHDVPMWCGAGEFLREYQQVQQLAGNDNVNASELLHVVLEAMDSPTGQRVYQQHRDKVALLVVDDAHNLDPASARFIRAYMRPGQRCVIAGDPDQCVFHFRGADEAFVNNAARDSDTVVELSTSFRVDQQVAQAINRLRDRLPAQRARVPLRGSDRDEPGLRVLGCSTETAQRLHIANEVRRAHVERNVPWKQIAVIVRSLGDIAGLRRTLMSYGVPVKVDSTSLVLAEQPLVAMMLVALEASSGSVSSSQMRRLVESSVGGADPVMVRRVQRCIHQAMRAHGRTALDAWEYLTELIMDPDNPDHAWMMEFIKPRERDVVDRVSRVIVAGRQAHRQGHSVEVVLWKIWQATELATHLQWRALRGGTSGAQADQDLDAVMNLFDMAGDFVERQPQASIDTFVEEVRAQELPSTGRIRRGSDGDAVEILPAHAAAGREWDEVVIAGIQEGSWPAGPTVGGLFRQLDLVDLIDHSVQPDQHISRVAEAVQEERRLFLLALSRARGRTTITVVKSMGDEALLPSRFLLDIGVVSQEQLDSDEPLDLGQQSQTDIPRVLALDSLVAELRDALIAHDDEAGDEASEGASGPSDTQAAAARNLAKLAEAGVYGADPSTWWGVRDASSYAAITTQTTQAPEIRLSPSRLEKLQDCALAAFLDSQGVVTPQTMHMRIGTVIHAIAEHIVKGMSLEDAQAAMRAVLPHVIDGPQWMKDRFVQEWTDGIDRLHGWITSLMDSDSTFHTEKSLHTVVGSTPDGTSVVLKGRADLVEVTPAGAAVIYDFKTSAHPLSLAQAETSLQLAAYQFIVADNGQYTPGGAALVYPFHESSTITVRPQAEITPSELEALRQDFVTIADVSSGPVFAATPGQACEMCQFKPVCPAQPEGKMVV